MSKHTPGPWGIRIATGTADRHIHAHGTLIAVVPYRENNTEERAANARLIAAAPDLLEACRHALRTLVACRDDLAASGFNEAEGDDICEEAKALTPAIKKLRAAIAKSEGKL